MANCRLGVKGKAGMPGSFFMRSKEANPVCAFSSRVPPELCLFAFLLFFPPHDPFFLPPSLPLPLQLTMVRYSWDRDEQDNREYKPVCRVCVCGGGNGKGKREKKGESRETTFFFLPFFFPLAVVATSHTTIFLCSFCFNCWRCTCSCFLFLFLFHAHAHM